MICAITGCLQRNSLVLFVKKSIRQTDGCFFMFYKIPFYSGSESGKSPDRIRRAISSLFAVTFSKSIAEI